jgi:hypothetical protein
MCPIAIGIGLGLLARIFSGVGRSGYPSKYPAVMALIMVEMGKLPHTLKKCCISCFVLSNFTTEFALELVVLRISLTGVVLKGIYHNVSFGGFG